MRKAVIDGIFYSPVVAATSFTVADHSTEHLTSDPAKASMAAPQSTENHPVTMASSQFERHPKRFHHIKRPRVENITQGTSGSHKARLPRDGGGNHEGGRTFLPACKWRMSPSKNRSYRLGGTSSDNREEFSKLQQRLWATQSFLGDLQSFQPSRSQDRHQEKVENYSPWSNRERDTKIPNRPDAMSQTCQDKEYKVSFSRDKMDRGQTSQEDYKNVMFPTGHAYLLETLKEELSKAVCQSVDHVFDNIFPTLHYQSHQAHDARPASFPGYTKPRSVMQMPNPPEPSGERGERPHLEFQGKPKLQLVENQEEAPSLVTNNPTPLIHDPPGHPAGKKPSNSVQTQSPFNQQNSRQEGLILDGTTSANSSCPCKIQTQDQISQDAIPWSQIKKASLNCTSVGHTVHPAALGQGPVSNLCHPGAFLSRDMQVVGKRNLLMKEGLTPNHLKKAKLMFFYCRYPSTDVLRTSFPDIKFNRCITSQLVKWFSNFREFYYIQMEKVSRQFVADGVSSESDLCVGRDSQLFRVLNTHFNRANDFQVPSRFLKVAEITLREFFNAISLAKDRDPSWKKVIYKVISKLDSDVPDVLKSPISW